MKNRSKSAMLALLLAGSVAMLGGCSKLKRRSADREGDRGCDRGSD
mgnify:CR=1 FL=1